MLPKLSIIIPYYNSIDYIEECINSVLNQTFTDYEMIIINDGSNIEAADFLVSKFGNNKKIKIYHKENGGVSSARNEGIRVANGEYITFLDSDDSIESDMYELMMNEFEENTDIVCCEVNRVKNNEIKNTIVKRPKETVSSEQAIKYCLIGDKMRFAVYDKIYRKSIFDENKIVFPEGKTMEEAAVLPYLFFKSRDIKYICEYKYNYYVRPNSYTTKVLTEECYYIFDTIEEYRKKIINIFPNIEKEINYYERKTIIPLYRTAVSQKKLIKKEVYCRIKKEFNKVLIPSLLDKRFSLKFKIMTIETMMGLHLLRRKYCEKK